MSFSLARARIATTKKKNNMPTGAKNGMRDASGPGFKRWGGTTPIDRFATRLSKVQRPCHPPPLLKCSVGLRLPSGKSTFAKLVARRRLKFVTREVPCERL